MEMQVKKVVSLGCLLAAGTMLWALADEAKPRTAMKQIGPTCSGLGKKITAKDASAAADAKKLTALFSDTAKYWKSAHAKDGVSFSKTAVTEFKSIGKLTSAGKWDEAGASFKKATATCGDCHGKHREKAADGSFKLK